MGFSVFAHDANPAIDRRLGKLSNEDAALLLGMRPPRARQIGPHRLQYLPPEKPSERGPYFSASAGDPVGWAKRISGDVAVLQMDRRGPQQRGVTKLRWNPAPNETTSPMLVAALVAAARA